jgi:predicted HTH domain antitoxin
VALNLIVRYVEARKASMATQTVALDESLLALLETVNESAERAASELIVLELYRRQAISSGKAAELLHMPRLAFIELAASVGIPFFRITLDDWEEEQADEDSP